MPNPMADGEKPKQRKSEKATAPKRGPARGPQKPEADRAPRSAQEGTGVSGAPQVIITEDEYRALVAQKAHELFVQRCALTEVDDWLQAERIVKEELLAQGQTAGFV